MIVFSDSVPYSFENHAMYKHRTCTVVFAAEDLHISMVSLSAREYVGLSIPKYDLIHCLIIVTLLHVQQHLSVLKATMMKSWRAAAGLWCFPRLQKSDQQLLQMEQSPNYNLEGNSFRTKQRKNAKLPTQSTMGLPYQSKPLPTSGNIHAWHYHICIYMVYDYKLWHKYM